MNPEEADEFLDSLEVGLKQGFKIPKESKDQVEKERKDRQERKRQEEEAAAKKATEEIIITHEKRSKKSNLKPSFSSFKPTFDSKDPLGLVSRPVHGPFGGGDTYYNSTTLIRSLYSDDIPQELAELCLPSKCLLCGILSLNSHTHARSHYLGKQHLKKAQAWFEQWSRRTQMPAPKMKSEILDENPDYCALCTVDLTSDVMARAHYQGENHARNKRKRDAAGNVPNDGTFGIGRGFKRKSDGEADSSESEVKILKVEPSPIQNAPRTYCTTCNRECNTRDEYKVHMMSTAHAARVAMAPSTSYMPEKPPLLPPPIAATPIRKGSVFMCQLCEVECSSEQMLEAHVNGKSHRKRREQKAYGGTAQKFRCDLCKIETTDQRGLEDHKRGKKHLKKMVDTGGY